ncbi:MAG: glycosyltransferase family 87 protein [Pseudomonadota bacterium]
MTLAAPAEAVGTGQAPDKAAGAAAPSASARGIVGAFETRPGRVLLILSVWAMICLGAMVLLFVVWRLTPPGTLGSVTPNDFSAFWAAGRMALEAGPVATLNPATLAPVQLYEPATGGREHYFPFLYPPAWLVTSLPLGALSYAVAYPLFVVLSFLGFMAACTLIAPPGALARRRTTFAMLAGGALLMFAQVYAGQLTLLWTAALIASLALAERGRPVAAGLVLGLCSIKPTLCLLLPIAVIASGDRRYIASASVSVILVAALPTLWTGPEYWSAWLGALAEQSDRAGNNIESLRGMLSWYAVLRDLGIDQPAATAMHALVTLTAAVAVGIAWWRAGIPFAARAGLLLIAIPFASPYAWYYELAVVFAGMLYLGRAGWGRSPVSWVLFLIVWALGGFLPFLSSIIEFRYLMAPLVTVAFIAALAQTGLIGQRAARLLG